MSENLPGLKEDVVTNIEEEVTEPPMFKVLLHNAHGPYHGLPRTAGWGYPEPYTRDLMISTLGILACGDERGKELEQTGFGNLRHLAACHEDPLIRRRPLEQG